MQLRVLDRVADVGILEMRFSLEHVRPKVSCSYRLYGCMAIMQKNLEHSMSYHHHCGHFSFETF